MAAVAGATVILGLEVTKVSPALKVSSCSSMLSRIMLMDCVTTVTELLMVRILVTDS